MSRRVITFSVAGKPIPQGSKSGRILKGRVQLFEQNDAARRRWRKAIADVAEQHRVTEIRQAPVRVRLTFFLGDPPKGIPADCWAPVRRGDADKLTRTVLDSLVDAKCIVDDAQVADLHVRKVYGGPGVVISITDLTGTKPNQELEQPA